LKFLLSLKSFKTSEKNKRKEIICLLSIEIKV
jgi:hypothetical protein